MNIRIGRIAFLLAMTLTAGAPSSAASLPTETLAGTLGAQANSAGASAVTFLPLSQPGQMQPNYIEFHFRYDFAPCLDDPPAATENREAPADLGQTMSTMISWITAKTHWKLSKAPAVRFVPQAQIEKMFTSGKPSNLVAHSLYCETDHSIYLPDDWNPDSLLDRSKLLHELVHHLQSLNLVQAACPAAYESQAYRLQAAWLRSQGVDDPLALMDVSPETIYVLSHCPEF